MFWLWERHKSNILKQLSRITFPWNSKYSLLLISLRLAMMASKISSSNSLQNWASFRAMQTVETDIDKIFFRSCLVILWYYLFSSMTYSQYLTKYYFSKSISSGKSWYSGNRANRSHVVCANDLLSELRSWNKIFMNFLLLKRRYRVNVYFSG